MTHSFDTVPYLSILTSGCFLLDLTGDTPMIIPYSCILPCSYVSLCSLSQKKVTASKHRPFFSIGALQIHVVMRIACANVADNGNLLRKIISAINARNQTDNGKPCAVL